MTEVRTSLLGWTVGLSTISTHCTMSASCLALWQSGVFGTVTDEASAGGRGEEKGGGER